MGRGVRGGEKRLGERGGWGEGRAGKRLGYGRAGKKGGGFLCVPLRRICDFVLYCI